VVDGLGRPLHSLDSQELLDNLVGIHILAVGRPVAAGTLLELGETHSQTGKAESQLKVLPGIRHIPLVEGTPAVARRSLHSPS